MLIVANILLVPMITVTMVSLFNLFKKNELDHCILIYWQNYKAPQNNQKNHFVLQNLSFHI